MPNRNWKETAELIGIASLVASLIFVGLQIRQDQDIAVAQIYADHDDTVIEWARLLSENRDLWVRGLKGDKLDDAENAVFVAIASTYFVMEGDRYARALLVSPVTPISIVENVAHTIAAYEPLEDIWRTRTYVMRGGGPKNSSLFEPYVNGVNEELGRIKSGEIELKSDGSFAPM